MNPDKFTHKTKALVSAHELAFTKGHAQFNPLHLAVVLVFDPVGPFRQSILNATGNSESFLASFERILNCSLRKILSQSLPLPPDEILASTFLIKVIHCAQSSQRSRGDTHLAIDQLILDLLEDS